MCFKVGILPLTINYKCQCIIAKDNDEVKKEKFFLFSSYAQILCGFEVFFFFFPL
jgi:hypothetical protein